ncbi:MAG: chemotaxis protein CheB [Brevinema sp.]
MSSGKVLIIDDSLLVRNYLSKTISSIPNLTVIDAVPNGELGFKKILEKQPDVVILDLEMQDGDGLYVLQNIEEHISFDERPFVLIYSSRAKYDDPIFKKAIDFGFCDFILKVEGNSETILSNLKNAFILKIISGIEAKQTRALLRGGGLLPSTSLPKTQPIAFPSIEKNKTPNPLYHKTITTNNIPKDLAALDKILQKKIIKPKLLILGASTGGPQVVRSILKQIDSEISIPIVIVQHMPEKFTKSFALELEASSDLPVHELRHNMALENGHAYVFPGGTHGRLNAFGNIYVYYTDRNNYDAHPFKPSVNLAIEHLLHSFNGHVIGVILSGMGNDGAIGMKKLHSMGSLIFAQDEQSSIVWGMPGSAVQQNAVDLILSQDDLGIGIVKALSQYGVHPK